MQSQRLSQEVRRARADGFQFPVSLTQPTQRLLEFMPAVGGDSCRTRAWCSKKAWGVTGAPILVNWSKLS